MNKTTILFAALLGCATGTFAADDTFQPTNDIETVRREVQRVLDQVEKQAPKVEREAQRVLDQVEEQAPKVEREAQRVLDQVEEQAPKVEREAQRIVNQATNLRKKWRF
ncbi:hypothetical protein [Candidatus Paracaedibacter symbiosus]|uniref:hypothetical protein n=1 Tax=Candidatus Paracaedibacter symbiosus TaxID=244582 RepID=UPI000509710B|nr:hypothetical protein [Candidatus Paracaedibacter symbiosus]